LRIAFLSVSAQLGGSETMLLQVMRELRATGGDCPLHLVVPADGPLSARAAALGASVSVVPMPDALRRMGESAHARAGLSSVALRAVRAVAGLPAYQAALARRLARIAPDVIHSNGFKAHIVSGRLRRAGAALVWHLHEYVSPRPLTRALLRRYARRCDLVVANSESVAADARGVIGSAPAVRVIHNAVDLHRFAPDGPVADLDALSGLSPSHGRTLRVGLVATFSRWKGHETFLHALAQVPGTLDVRGYVIGGPIYDTDGSQYSLEELRALAAGLGLDRRVGFAGFVGAPETALRALDIVVHASTEPEPFGLVIAEAMACGRAVVTSGTGGAAELVRDGVDAVVYQAGDARDLAASIVRLATDGPLRASAAAAARARAVEAFDARRIGGQFAAAYDEARAVRRAR
jgi:glycosyltransferase involved in cell wall biosynthesis